MPEPSCRVCGCTDLYGCPERCHWVEPDLCSVCSGATPRRRDRHHTRTASAIHPAFDVPAGWLAIMAPEGILRAVARTIADAQWVARALDYYQLAINARAARDLQPGPAALISAEISAFGQEMTVKHWQRGPVARRPRRPLIIGR